MTNDEWNTIRRILDRGRTATVTTRSAHGSLHSRPLALLVRDEFEGTLWFFTQDPSAKTAALKRHPDVNVAVGDAKGWLSLSGTASVSRDAEVIDHYWNVWAEAYFDRGREDPKVALLEVKVDTIEYWDLEKPAVARAFEVVKGVVTRSAPDIGESGTVVIR